MSVRLVFLKSVQIFIGSADVEDISRPDGWRRPLDGLRKRKRPANRAAPTVVIEAVHFFAPSCVDLAIRADRRRRNELAVETRDLPFEGAVWIDSVKGFFLTTKINSPRRSNGWRGADAAFVVCCKRPEYGACWTDCSNASGGANIDRAIIGNGGGRVIAENAASFH